MAEIAEQAKKQEGEKSSEIGGVASPSETIKSSLLLVEDIVKAKGSATPVTRKEISVITGKAEATLILKISTCVQYTVLVNRFGKGYLPGKLYEQYIEPTYEEDRRKVLLKILNSPPLYRKLIEEFNGKILPSEQGLANHLKNVYKLNAAPAARAAKIFLENLHYVDVIDANKKLRYIAPTDEADGSESSKEKESPGGNGTPPPGTSKENKREEEEDGLIEIKIPLKKGKAIVKFPEDYDDADLDKIARIVKAYKHSESNQ